MTAEKARNRIAKIRNDLCYSYASLCELGEINNKDYKETSEDLCWSEER